MDVSTKRDMLVVRGVLYVTATVRIGTGVHFGIDEVAMPDKQTVTVERIAAKHCTYDSGSGGPFKVAYFDDVVAAINEALAQQKAEHEHLLGVLESANASAKRRLERAEAAESRLAEVMGVLREHEWEGWVLDCEPDPAVRRPYCKNCRCDNTQGHSPDCWLAALLSKGGEVSDDLGTTWKDLHDIAAGNCNRAMTELADLRSHIQAKDAKIAELEQRHVRFMVQGGPVVMATEYERVNAQLSERDTELFKLRAELQKMCDVADFMPDELAELLASTSAAAERAERRIGAKALREAADHFEERFGDGVPVAYQIRQYASALERDDTEGGNG